MTSLRKFAIATIIATYALITIGATVRASGSGLGCPDWPRCFGNWIPPTSIEDIPAEFDRSEVNIAKTWTEYLNRLAGVVVGLLILSATISAWRHARRDKRVTFPTTAALALVIFQGWQGGQVVKHELDPRLVTIHLFLAIVIVVLLVYAALQTWRERFPLLENLSGPRSLGRKLTGLALAIATTELIIGALVRGTIEIIAAEQPGLTRDDWLAEVGLFDDIHRKLALLLAAVSIVTWRAGRKIDDAGKWLKRVFEFNFGCVIAQIAVGLGLAYWGFDPVLQVLHITFGTWLLGGLYIQFALVHRGEELSS